MRLWHIFDEKNIFSRKVDRTTHRPPKELMNNRIEDTPYIDRMCIHLKSSIASTIQPVSAQGERLGTISSSRIFGVHIL